MSIPDLLVIFALFLSSIVIWGIIGLLWGGLRKFFHKSYSYFDATFILAYFIEQLLLTMLLAKTSLSPQLLAGIFAMIVITTASLQKLMLESRLKEISEKSVEQKTILDEIIEINDSLIVENKRRGEIIQNLKDFIKQLIKLQKKG